MLDAKDARPVALLQLLDCGASIGLIALFRGTIMCNGVAPVANGIVPCALSMIQIGCKSVGHLLYPLYPQCGIHGHHLPVELAHAQQLEKFSLDGRSLCNEYERILWGLFNCNEIVQGHPVIQHACRMSSSSASDPWKVV